MANFNKDIYMTDHHLAIYVYGDVSSMYQFIYNPDTSEFSDLYPYEDGLEFEIEKDGLYRIITIQNPDAELVNNGLQVGNRIFTLQDLANLVGDGSAYDPTDIGEYDVDDTLFIYDLKKCLAELELKMFQEMLKNCGSVKCKNNEIKSQYDFLFIAVWLIEHYIELGNIVKAQAIYNSLKSCGNLCQSLLNNKKGCGCNG